MAETNGKLGRKMPKAGGAASAPHTAPRSDEPFMSDSERLKVAFDHELEAPTTKTHVVALRDKMRAFLYKNCQIEMHGDQKGPEFAQQIRDGVDFPGTCRTVASMESLLDKMVMGGDVKEAIVKVNKTKASASKQDEDDMEFSSMPRSKRGLA